MIFWLQVFGAVIFGVYASWKIHSKFWVSRQNEALRFNDEKAPENIIPLPNFEWRTTEPLKIRPFKPVYHMTMGMNSPLELPRPITLKHACLQNEGLQSCSQSELIEIDRTYVDRLAIRTSIIRDHKPTVLQALPSSHAAIRELYTYLTTVYLPTRFPSIYSLTPTYLLNKATNHHMLLNPSSPLQALYNLGTNIDTDFLLLVSSPDGDGYILGGFIACFPSGFDTQALLGKKIRDIHKPVPKYKEKLETSMYRSFGRLEVGKMVKRFNWSITTHARLFAASGNHLYEGDEAKAEEFDINDTYLRCERQLVHRLPKTKVLVFSVRTYLTPLTQVKEEGLGEELAEAIDGLKKGSVPEIHYYKRGVVWGETVKEYLRS